MSATARPSPIVIAHRGGAGEAPENTVQAFERAIHLGYPGVEFDVRQSMDGVPLVVHDERVRIAPDARPCLVDALDAADLGLPTLSDVLGLAWGEMVLMVEVKPTRRDRELGALVAAEILRKRRASQAIVASFSAEVLRSVFEAAPELRLMGLLDSETPEQSFAGLPLFAWGVDVALLDANRVRRWKSPSREVWTWTIKNRVHLAKALAAGVDGLISDVPGEVLRILRSTSTS
jgi:glycerophosphoryl diester phosphodiesterase